MLLQTRQAPDSDCCVGFDNPTCGDRDDENKPAVMIKEQCPVFLFRVMELLLQQYDLLLSLSKSC